jgi:type IV secretory pathway VirB2 component (pilin)
MFRLSKIESSVLVLVIVSAIILCPSDAFAAFGALAGAGKKIFEGLKSIIYPASAIGIICVCIGGFFGNINWKWLMALIVGLVVIACCGGFIYMFAGQNGGINSADTLNGE